MKKNEECFLSDFRRVSRETSLSRHPRVEYVPESPYRLKMNGIVGFCLNLQSHTAHIYIHYTFVQVMAMLPEG